MPLIRWTSFLVHPLVILRVLLRASLKDDFLVAKHSMLWIFFFFFLSIIEVV